MTRLQIKMFILLILCLVRVIDTSMDPANQGESSKIAGFPVRFVKHNQRQEPSSKSKRFDYRWGLSTSINFNILQVPENTTLLSRTYEKQMPSLRLTKQGQAFNSSGKDSPSSSSDEARSLDCPISCICTYRSDRTVDTVDCSNKGLTKIPVLPVSSRGVYLQNNNIRIVPCTSFGSLKLLKKLDLSENQIATLPRCSFANTRTLQLLRLSRCQLTSLQEGVFNSLQNLLQLDLSENNINNMEQNLFTNLNKLESLDLSKNKITRVRNDTFRGLNSLMFLSLQENVLYYLLETFESNAFKGLDSLQSLHLEGNQPYLPDNFKYPDQALAQIPTLRRVWLDGYPRKLGPGFSSLVNLSHLSFASGNGGFCSMKSNMPEHFFIHLKTKQPLNLNMSLCDISEISPVVLNHVPTIHTLDLSSNQDLSIDGFEKASKGLQNTTIAVLNIGNIAFPFSLYNVIKNTTFQFLKQTSLTDLVIEHCNVGNVDSQAILDLPQTVEYLSFQGNDIWKSFGIYSLNHLRNLKTLRISHQLDYNRKRNNSLSEVFSHTTVNYIPRQEIFTPETVYSFSETNALSRNKFYASHTSHQSFCGVPENGQNGKTGDSAIMPLPQKLEVLYASDIKVSYNIPKTYFFNNKVLKYIDYSSNDVRCLGGPLYGLPSLEYIDLSYNFCFKLSPLFFSQMHGLKTVIFNDNWLGRSLASDTDGVTFSTLTLLENLDLRYNSIDDLSEDAFKNNMNLEVLDLSHNKITQFRPSLANNMKLKLLDLSSNHLGGISERTCLELQRIKKNSSNFTVMIEGNNFLCQCDKLHFLNFLLGQPEIFEDVENAFHCQLTNGSLVNYGNLAAVMPQIGLQCFAQTIFLCTLVAFFLVTGGLAIFGFYHF